MKEPEIEGLNLPHVEQVTYTRNFIRQAVCELRFPTQLEMENKPPIELQKRLRKDYPLYQKLESVNLKPGDSVPERHDKHIFRSRDRKWSVAFTASSISLETEEYRDFASFAARMRRMLEAAEGSIDSDFFTRLGMRYINAIPSGSKKAELAEWVNPQLVAALVSGTYGRVVHYWNEVKGACDGGQYTFAHGFQQGAAPAGTPAEYILDFDFFGENVGIESVHELASLFNQQCFDFFRWAAGTRTLDAMKQSVKS